MSVRNRLILLARRIDKLDPPKKRNRGSFFNIGAAEDPYMAGFYYGTLLAQEEIWKWVRREKKK
jgi:hypothetical protein